MLFFVLVVHASLSTSQACSSNGKILQVQNLLRHASDKSQCECYVGRDHTSYRRSRSGHDTHPDSKCPHNCKPYPFPLRSRPSGVSFFLSSICGRQVRRPHIPLSPLSLRSSARICIQAMDGYTCTALKQTVKLAFLAMCPLWTVGDTCSEMSERGVCCNC
jgi:hypothetical protein